MKTLADRLQGLITRLRTPRTNRVSGLFVGFVGFAAAVATLHGPVRDLLAPTEFRVYVLHPYASAQEEIWRDFDDGLGDFLAEHGGGLDTGPLKLGKYELDFDRKTWKNEEELRQQVDELVNDDRALAVIAATNSRHSEILLDGMPDTGGPVVLLALATSNDLLARRATEKAATAARPRAFRLVPSNGHQAHRLASVIVTPTLADCASSPTERVSVVILREEKDNATFSRELSAQLREILETDAQHVEVLADAVVDPVLVLPRELVDLEPDFLVYIGSQNRAAIYYRQLLRLGRSSEGDRCVPKLVLTDAGILGDGRAGYRGQVEASFATLPLARETTSNGKAPASFFTVGWDSGELLFEAAGEVLQTPPGALDRAALSKALSGVVVEGQAQAYEFRADGENKQADFHLWKVSQGVWRHLDDCRAENHPGPSSWRVAAAGGVRLVNNPSAGDDELLRIGAKPFPEQQILAELTVKLLNEADIPARRGQESLNGIRDLLLFNEIDAYWEYTGTGIHRHHGHPGMRGEEAMRALRRLDGSQIVWLSPLDVNNPFVLIATRELARSRDIRTISELARSVEAGSDARLCAPSRWFGFNDGLVGLEKHYGFRWPEEQRQPLEPDLIYSRLGRLCDVAVAAATDAELDSSNKVILEDDRQFFSDYRPALVFREDVYRVLEEEHPRAMNAFERRLSCVRQVLDQDRMLELNAMVSLEGRSAEWVAGYFLDTACPTPPEPPGTQT